jgi:alpha-L-rhamnosidase
MSLWEKGYSFDCVSDRFVARAECKGRRILLGGNEYKVLIVPECRMMPLATLERLLQLANDGANIIFQNKLSSEVPGFGDLERRRAKLREMESGLKWTNRQSAGRYSEIGRGRLIIAEILEAALEFCGIRGEPCVEAGLRFIRRRYSDGFIYFLANRSELTVDKTLTLQTPVMSAVIFDPRFESRVGSAQSFIGGEGPFEGRVHLQLQPGESCIVRTFTNSVVKGPIWPYVTNAGPTQQITGTWKVEFPQGEPQISQSVQVSDLTSWTSFDVSELKAFTGTGRYTITFDRSGAKADDWMLDLGKVCESARVKLNGHPLGALWCAPCRETVGEWLRPGKNTLEVEVTNLAANRIADLDRRKVRWKYFYDINVASKRYRSLDASDWPLFDSGLLGPVTLTPLKKMAVN